MKINVQEISIASKPDCTFYLKLQWDKDLGTGFVVLLCDGVSAWSGEVSEEDVNKEAQDMEMPIEKYVNDLQLILTGEEQASQSYSFYLTPKQPGSSILQLSYEKVRSNMSFRFGTVELLPVPDPTKVITDLISYGLKRSADLRTKKKHMEKENQGLRNKLDNITAEMQGYIKEKEELEKELYNRFVLILNEKKHKIRTLQEKIKHMQNTTHGTQRRNKEDESQREKEVANEKLENDDYFNTTDEEEDEEPEVQNQKPSTQALTNNPMDNSQNDIADVAPSRKRRIRGIPPSESQTNRPPPKERQNLRSDLIGGGKEKASKVFVEKPHAIPDPDELFDDI